MDPKTLRKFFVVSAMYLAGIAGPAPAADDAVLVTEARSMDRLAVSQGESTVTEKMGASFAGFAGSEENAESLIYGLRHGSQITLATSTGSKVSFIAPTRPMGYGNAFISLALAREQLAADGILQPTPEEIQAALNGGTVVTGSGATAQTFTYPGVLKLRAQGMGWGQIANALGLKLGPVASGMKAANGELISSGRTQAGAGTGVGITTAAGSAAASASLKGNASVSHFGRFRGQGGDDAGIVSAAGAATSAQGGITLGGGQGGGSGMGGIVNGQGAGAFGLGGGLGLGHGRAGR